MKNLSVDQLIKDAVKNREGKLTSDGVLYTETGKHTGRSPDAKAIVMDDETRESVDWNSNAWILASQFRVMAEKFEFYKNNRNIYTQDVWAVRDHRYSVPVRVYTKDARHSLFTRNMFVPHEERSKLGFSPEWEVFHFPGLSSLPMVWISMTDKKILIAGTQYSGEIKKSVFTVLNYLFPKEGHLPMHCSVNADLHGKNTAIFFGLSGTGKTTLSSDTNRILIGDDEHAWTIDGLTNFEGGCYAKTINLSQDDEPQIYEACHKKGAILENVVVKNGKPDFFDSSLTENGRASYPTSFISGADEKGWVDEHPTNIVMLTCDAFGVLPPVMKLSSDEAVEQFLLGYTAKVAGTEKGVTEPKATFSPCFGAPFMPLPPDVYGKILKEKIEKHGVDCWLVNTGWTGGPYGVGKRMPISITRRIIDSIHNGNLAIAKFAKHEYTGFEIPLVHESFIPEEMLEPEKGWDDLEEYKNKVSELMGSFKALTNN